jgi:uncharacterized membrane protein
VTSFLEETKAKANRYKPQIVEHVLYCLLFLLADMKRENSGKVCEKLAVHEYAANVAESAVDKSASEVGHE